MRLQFQQLAADLARALAPVYLICGDEPLQLAEAARKVREAARARGFEERELLEADAAFDWGRLAAAGSALSLFCSRKQIELRLQSARIGREGSEAVRAYCSDPSPDNLLLILAPELERQELKAKWVEVVERTGVLLQVRQITGRGLVDWIVQRLAERGLRPEAGVAALLAERVEGNLPAAAQEIEKLALLYGEGNLDRAQLLSAIADSARYDLFDLTDAASSGHRARVQRILQTLEAEGTAPALVLWALARELRTLASVSYAAGGGGTAAALRAHNVWESRKGLVLSAVKRHTTAGLQALVARCALIDLTIKGLAPGDPWHGLAVVADDLAAGEAQGPNEPDRAPKREPNRAQARI